MTNKTYRSHFKETYYEILWSTNEIASHEKKNLYFAGKSRAIRESQKLPFTAPFHSRNLIP